MKNKIQVSGTVANNLRVHEYRPNKKRAFFSILVDSSFVNDRGKRKKCTNRFNVTGWGDLAKLVEAKIKIGQEVEIEGKLENNKYRDKSGNMIFENQIIISKILSIEGVNNKELTP
jgi:single-stranded DNA-binding protein